MRSIALATLLALAIETSADARPAPVEVPLRVVVRKLARKISRLRGLRRRRRIRASSVSRAQILARMKKRIASRFSDEELANEGAVLRRLGLLPQGTDYKQALLKLLAGQVAGFYDPIKRRLSVASWLPIAAQRPALVHEICHALQDQSFPLRRLLRPFKQDGDRQLARAALVEGDCMGVMIEHALAPSGLDLSSMTAVLDKLLEKLLAGSRGSASLRAAPRYLRRTLTFPYEQGLRMVQRLRRRQSWAAINRLFRRPPRSSEQVLHYDKLLRRERPVAIRDRSLPSLAGLYSKIRRDTLGELRLRIYLEGALSRQAAERAAAGWGGDRLVAYRENGTTSAPIVVQLSSWDSEADAIEFYNAQQHLLLARAPRRLGAASQPSLRVYVDRCGLQWSVQRHRKSVLSILGAPASLRPALQREVWVRWRVGGRRLRPRFNTARAATGRRSSSATRRAGRAPARRGRPR